MKRNKNFLFNKLFILLLLGFVSIYSVGQTVSATWVLTSGNLPSSVTNNITAYNHFFGSQLTSPSNSSNGAGAKNWNSTTSIATISTSDTGKYYQFSLKANARIVIKEIDATVIAGSNCKTEVRYSKSSSFSSSTSAYSFPTSTTSNTWSTYNATIPVDIDEVIYFRVYTYDLSPTSKYFYCKDFKISGDTCTSPQVSSFIIDTVYDVCAGIDSSLVKIKSSSLVSGSYTINYNLSGDNTSSSSSANIVFTAGSPGLGTFKIPKELLANSGHTQISIYNISPQVGCNTPFSPSKTYIFNVIAPSAPLNINSLSGSNLICPLISSNVYTVNDGGSASSFLWTLPLGWNLESGSGSKQVNLKSGDYTGLNDTIKIRLLNSCKSRDTFLVVNVKPSPTLSTVSAKLRCTNVVGSYIASSDPSTTFSWTRPVVAGISNPSKSGSGSTITDTLINTTASAVKVPYNFTLTLNGCSSLRSDTLTINPGPNSNNISSSNTICYNSISDTLKGTVSGGTGSYSYLWQSSILTDSSGFGSAGGTNNASSYYPAGLTQNTWYRRVVTSGTCSLTSTPVKITVTPQITSNTITIGGQSGVRQFAICLGDIVSTLNGSSPSGGSGSISYQWERSLTDSLTGFNYLANTQSYAPGAIQQSVWFRRIVIIGNCRDTSSTIKINVVTTDGVISPDTSRICRGKIQKLSASRVTIFDAQDFSDNAQGWTQSQSNGSPNSLNFGNPQSNEWVRYRSGDVVNAITFQTPDNSDFLMTQCKQSSTITNSVLISPAQNTSGYSTCFIVLSVSFKTVSVNDAGYVEVSTDNVNWTIVKTYSSSIGSATNFIKDKIDISLIGNRSAAYIRFRYIGSYGGWWGINDLSIDGVSNNLSNYVWFPASGLYSDSLGTVSYIAGTPAAVVYAKPDTSTVYSIGSSSGNCLSPYQASININSSAVITGQPSANSICLGGNDTLKVQLDNISQQSTLQYQWYLSNDGGVSWSNITDNTIYSGSSSSSLKFINPPVSLSTSKYKLKISVNGACPVESNAIALKLKNVWVGNVGTDWSNTSNWSDNSIPTIVGCEDVYIQGNRPFQPVISGVAAVKNINLLSGSLLTINGGELKVSGTISSSANINAASGTVEMNGSVVAQALSGSMFTSRLLKNLTISNTAGLNLLPTVNDTLKVSGLLKFGNVSGSFFNTNNNLTLLSDSSNTAAVGDLTNGGANNNNNSIRGNVNVERYIATGRKWRFLSIPTNTSQTFQQSWQEGNASALNSRPGYGTMVTDNNNSTYLANGFDYYSAGGPSVKKYNVSSQGYTPISSTSDIINISGGYMVYVRGDRSATPTNGLNTSTILRTSGVIKQGDQPSIVVPAGKYVDIGNPFPSAINMSSITRVGVQNVFYLWDPKMGGAFGLGGYQTFTNIGGDYYLPTPGGYSYPSDSGTYNLIQSGQAFFVRGSSVGGSVTIKESDKATGSRQVFRTGSNPQYLKINLNNFSNSVAQLVDGATAVYGDAYQNAVDNDDALKITNSGVNVSLKREGQLLAVEFRHTMMATDTLYINMTGLSAQPYQWNLIFYNLDSLGREAFLLDSYLNNFTPLNVGGNNFIDFSVDNNPASKDAGRFKIVFVHSLALPVTITQISAKPISDKAVQIDWKTESEISMDYYIVEKSTTGNNFQEICGKVLPQNNSGAAFYSQLDNSYSNTVSFYRIKAVSLNGMIQYSSIVKVTPKNLNSSVSVFPNPVIGKKINIQFSNMELGLYHLSLYSGLGQQVFSKDVDLLTPNKAQIFELGDGVAAGSYRLLVIGPSGGKENLQVIIR